MAHFFVFNRRSARIPIFGGWDLQHFVFFLYYQVNDYIRICTPWGKFITD